MFCSTSNTVVFSYRVVPGTRYVFLSRQQYTYESILCMHGFSPINTINEEKWSPSRLPYTWYIRLRDKVAMRFYLVPVYLRVPGIRTTNTRWRCRRINTSWYVALHGTAVPGTLFLLEPPTRTASVLLVYCSYRALNKTTTIITIVLSWLAGSV